MDYYRNKILEFQNYLNGLAATSDIMLQLIQSADPSSDLYASLHNWLADLQNNTIALQIAAGAVNTAAEGANALGARVPELSIPQSLAALPIIAIAAIAAAVAGTAWAVSYAVGKMEDAKVILSTNQTIAGAPPDQQAAVASALSKVQAAQASAASPWGTLSTLAMWAGIAVAAWFGFKAFQEFRS